MFTVDVALDDFSNGVHPVALLQEIAAEAGITTAAVGIQDPTVDPVKIDFEGAGPLSGSEETALASVVAAHTGTLASHAFLASSKLIENERSVTSDSTFEQVGGVVTQVDEFADDLSKVIGRVRGSVKSSGTGGRLQLVEEGSPDTVMHSGEWVIPDTSGAWQTFEFVTDQAPGSGPNTFRLEAKLGGATSVDLRFVSLALLREVS